MPYGVNQTSAALIGPGTTIVSYAAWSLFDLISLSLRTIKIFKDFVFDLFHEVFNEWNNICLIILLW